MENLKLAFHILNGIMCFIGYATTFMTIIFIVCMIFAKVTNDPYDQL